MYRTSAQPVQAIADMYGVLRHGGIAVIADLRRNASPEEIEQHIKRIGLNRIDQVITRWTFNQMLLKRAYSIEDMESIISQTPFGKGKIDLDGISVQVWLKK